MIKCVIIDDEQPSIDIIESYVNDIPELELVGKTTNPLDALKIISETKPDLVFLDIQMDPLNGLELAKALPIEVKIIFCTAYAEFAAESYELDVVDYLLKPIPFGRFVKGVSRVSNKISIKGILLDPDDNYIFVRADHKGKLLKINVADISYIVGRSNYVDIYTGDSFITSYSSMSNIMDKLAGAGFIRVHRSYIVAFNRVTKFENGELTLSDAKRLIPVSETYRKDLMNDIKNKLL